MEEAPNGRHHRDAPRWSLESPRGPSVGCVRCDCRADLGLLDERTDGINRNDGNTLGRCRRHGAANHDADCAGNAGPDAIAHAWTIPEGTVFNR